jgi:hypothetical protein
MNLQKVVFKQTLKIKNRFIQQVILNEYEYSNYKHDSQINQKFSGKQDLNC